MNKRYFDANYLTTIPVNSVMKVTLPKARQYINDMKVNTDLSQMFIDEMKLSYADKLNTELMKSYLIQDELVIDFETHYLAIEFLKQEVSNWINSGKSFFAVSYYSAAKDYARNKAGDTVNPYSTEVNSIDFSTFLVTIFDEDYCSEKILQSFPYIVKLLRNLQDHNSNLGLNKTNLENQLKALSHAIFSIVFGDKFNCNKEVQKLMDKLC